MVFRCEYYSSTLFVISESFNVQEDNDARYVIDYALLLAPPLERGADQFFSCTFCILLQIQGVNDSGYVNVLQEFPNTVACYDDHFVVFCESVLAHFWKSIATD